MAQAIYPQELRENCLFSMYAEIAMESYYKAERKYEEIKANNYVVSSMWELGEIEKQIICTVVFSAMCVESFLNNYAGACLGDKEFGENFDRLSPVSKLQLIAKFILHANVNTGEALYSRIKQLFRERDKYVHNKSKKTKYQGMTAAEFEDFQKNDAELFEEGRVDDGFPKEELDKDMRIARDALKALKDIASLFDEYDSEAFARERIFRPSGVIFGHDTEREYKRIVFRVVGIKVDKNLAKRFSDII